MAFGVDYTNFLDSFDVGAVAGANNRERAKLKSQTFLTDSKLGGAATSIQARNKAEDIMAKANASAQSSAQNASTFGNIMGAVGSIGSFGAAGGFGGGGGVPGDGGAAAGMTTPWDKGYDFFKSGTPSFTGDLTYDFGGMASNMGY